jgi:hypothetical protein
MPRSAHEEVLPNPAQAHRGFTPQPLRNSHLLRAAFSSSLQFLDLPSQLAELLLKKNSSPTAARHVSNRPGKGVGSPLRHVLLALALCPTSWAAGLQPRATEPAVTVVTGGE